MTFPPFLSCIPPFVVKYVLVCRRVVEDRSTCSNIADNPVHDTLPDKLVGVHTVVELSLIHI